MALIERDVAIRNVPNDLAHANSIRRTLMELPVVDAVPRAFYEQVKWERDEAIKKLKMLGVDVQFGKNDY